MVVQATTHNQEPFRELDKTIISKFRIGNGAYLAAKGKGTVTIKELEGLTKEDLFAVAYSLQET